jgi:hypothetical protein
VNLISFSLFGNADHYQYGAMENLRLAPTIYPGWVVRFYVEDGMQMARKLASDGAQVVLMPRAPGAHAMCWRFLPAGDPTIERVIVRDCDSRLNVREAAAVSQWIKSGRVAHTMADHEHHCGFPMLGGMWGVSGGALPQIGQWIERWETTCGKPWGARLDDMKLLRHHVWPQIAGDCCRHATYPNPWGGDPFPEHPHYDSFVGAQV